MELPYTLTRSIAPVGFLSAFLCPSNLYLLVFQGPQLSCPLSVSSAQLSCAWGGSTRVTHGLISLSVLLLSRPGPAGGVLIYLLIPEHLWESVAECLGLTVCYTGLFEILVPRSSPQAVI